MDRINLLMESSMEIMILMLEQELYTIMKGNETEEYLLTDNGSCDGNLLETIRDTKVVLLTMVLRSY